MCVCVCGCQCSWMQRCWSVLKLEFEGLIGHLYPVWVTGTKLRSSPYLQPIHGTFCSLSLINCGSMQVSVTGMHSHWSWARSGRVWVCPCAMTHIRSEEDFEWQSLPWTFLNAGSLLFVPGLQASRGSDAHFPAEIIGAVTTASSWALESWTQRVKFARPAVLPSEVVPWLLFLFVYFLKLKMW